MQQSQALSIKNTPLVAGPLRTITKCENCGARAYNMCSGIGTEGFERLSSIAMTMNVAPGRGFIEEGAPAEYFFNVTAGTAKVFKQMPNGRHLITCFAGLGYFLGLASSTAYAFSAEALDNVRICRYSRLKLRAFLAEFPAMEVRLLEIASDELVAAQEQILLLGRKSVRERMASFLISLKGVSSHREGHVSVVIDSVSVPMTRSDIADYLGLTTETVSRTFTRLAREEIIAIPSASCVTIRNYAALKAIATGTSR